MESFNVHNDHSIAERKNTISPPDIDSINPMIVRPECEK